MRYAVLLFLTTIVVTLRPASAELEFLQQSGQITVSGQLGTFTATAPADQPWFANVNAGVGGPIWFAQSFISTNWQPDWIVIYPEALVRPGMGASLLTQSLTDVSITFRATEPTTLFVDFIAAPNQVGSGMPVDSHVMQLIDFMSGQVVLDGEVLARGIAIDAGEYQLKASNYLGNTVDNLTLPEGARMLSILVAEVIPGDANRDGVVDGTDFGIWNANRFTSNTNWYSGDFNDDGNTDGSDFAIWNAHKFTAAATVPEPTSLLMCCLSVLAVRSAWHKSAA